MRICIGCGCSEGRACVTDGVPCHWASTNPPLCSACDDLAGSAYDGDPELAEDVATQACPASSKPIGHLPIWTSESTCYCIRCREKFAA